MLIESENFYEKKREKQVKDKEEDETNGKGDMQEDVCGARTEGEDEEMISSRHSHIGVKTEMGTIEEWERERGCVFRLLNASDGVLGARMEVAHGWRAERKRNDGEDEDDFFEMMFVQSKAMELWTSVIAESTRGFVDETCVRSYILVYA